MGRGVTRKEAQGDWRAHKQTRPRGNGCKTQTAKSKQEVGFSFVCECVCVCLFFSFTGAQRYTRKTPPVTGRLCKRCTPNEQRQPQRSRQKRGGEFSACSSVRGGESGKSASQGSPSVEEADKGQRKRGQPKTTNQKVCVCLCERGGREAVGKRRSLS